MQLFSTTTSAPSTIKIGLSERPRSRIRCQPLNDSSHESEDTVESYGGKDVLVKACCLHCPLSSVAGCSFDARLSSFQNAMMTTGARKRPGRGCEYEMQVARGKGIHGRSPMALKVDEGKMSPQLKGYCARLTTIEKRFAISACRRLSSEHRCGLTFPSQR